MHGSHVFFFYSPVNSVCVFLLLSVHTCVHGWVYGCAYGGLKPMSRVPSHPPPYFSSQSLSQDLELMDSYNLAARKPRDLLSPPPSANTGMLTQGPSCLHPAVLTQGSSCLHLPVITQGPSCPHPPLLWSQVCIPAPGFSTVLGIPTQLLVFAWQAIYLRSPQSFG